MRPHDLAPLSGMAIGDALAGGRKIDEGHKGHRSSLDPDDIDKVKPSRRG